VVFGDTAKNAIKDLRNKPTSFLTPLAEKRKNKHKKAIVLRKNTHLPRLV
jgi:hypothetical protein